MHWIYGEAFCHVFILPIATLALTLQKGCVLLLLGTKCQKCQSSTATNLKKCKQTDLRKILINKNDKKT